VGVQEEKFWGAGRNYLCKIVQQNSNSKQVLAQNYSMLRNSILLPRVEFVQRSNFSYRGPHTKKSPISPKLSPNLHDYCLLHSNSTNQFWLKFMNPTFSILFFFYCIVWIEVRIYGKEIEWIREDYKRSARICETI